MKKIKKGLKWLKDYAPTIKIIYDIVKEILKHLLVVGFLFPSIFISMEIKTNTIYNGECIEVMKFIPDGSVDMILCDLPYSCTHNQWDSLIPFKELWQEYNRVIKDNGAIVLTSAGKFTIQLINSNPKMYRYSWIWVKNNVTNFANAKRQPMRNHEDVLVFFKRQPTYNPQGLRDKLINRNKAVTGESYRTPSLMQKYVQTQTGYPKSVLQFNRDKDFFHPTQKPVALFEYLIKTYTNEGETVLDNCIGGGCTAIAALNAGRQFIGIELNEKYCNITNERINCWHSDSSM